MTMRQLAHQKSAVVRSFVLATTLSYGLVNTACVAETPPGAPTKPATKTPTQKTPESTPKSANAPQDSKTNAGPSQRMAWELAEQLGQRIVSTSKKPGQTKEAFVAEVEELLSTLIDFDIFAVNVMGKYGTQSYVDALPKKKRASYQKQIKKFSKVFRKQLIDVYSTTFWNVAKKVTLKTLEPTASTKPNQQVIRQEVHGVSEQAVLIYYQMVVKGNTWQIKNLAVQGVNLAKIYRQQFYDLMTEHGEDINKVVSAWQIS